MKLICDKMKVIEAKIVVLGSQGVGKTSLVVRYIGKMFSRHISPTIGASFFTCKINLNDSTVKLQVWDTAGQERFRSMAPMYYRNANAALLVFDISSKQSFNAIKGWVKELKSNVPTPLCLSLVGNKSDLEHSREVNATEAAMFARDIGAAYCETSALHDRGIEQVFTSTASALLEAAAAAPSMEESVLQAGAPTELEATHTGKIELPAAWSIENIAHADNVPTPLCLSLVGNKSDLEHSREVNAAEAAMFARDIGAAYCETSALHDRGIEQVFTSTASALLEAAAAAPSMEESVLQAGAPTELEATHTGKIELPAAWSIENIAHADNVPTPLCLSLVGNKSDLEHSREVNASEAAMFARDIGAAYCETSALHDRGIEQVFTSTASALLEAAAAAPSMEESVLQAGAPTELEATHTGKIELPAAWSIENIAHADNVPTPLCLSLVGNKSDLEHSREVNASEAAMFARDIGAAYCETSALHDRGIEQVFTSTASALLEAAAAAPSMEESVLQAGAPTELEATHTGKIELPAAWSIENIAHAEYVQRNVCC